MSNPGANRDQHARAWRRGTAPPAHARSKPWPWTPRQRQLYFLAAALAVVCGAILVWALLPRALDEPVFLSIPITQYSDPGLPPNAWAEQDGDLLLAHFASKESHKLTNCQEGNQLLNELATIQKTKAHAVVVHLRAHALAVAGRVYLLPGNATLGQPRSWVALDEVLKALGECNTPRRLLLLDVARPLAVPVLGPLADDVATTLDAFLKEELKRPDRSMLVLCSCGPGQTSHVSEGLGVSAFAYYLHEGLRGKADGISTRRHLEGRVSARELADFVTRRVARWAEVTRGVGQIPVLYGDGPDFDLVSTATERPKPLAPRDELTYASWLLTGWELRDRWWVADTYHTQPLLLRRLDAVLLRAEQRWRAGVNERDLRNEMPNLLKEYEKLHLPRQSDTPAEGSLALARAAGRTTDGAALKPLEDVLDQLEKLKPDETEKRKAEVARVIALKAQPLELAEAIVQAARNLPRAERLAALADVLTASGPLDQFAEVRWLRRLAMFCQEYPADAARLPPGTLRKAVDAVVDLEQAAVFDPRAQPWLIGRLNDAADARREGFTRLLGRQPGGVTLLERTVLFSGEVSDAAQKLQVAFDLRDLVLATLPSVARYLLARPGQDTRAVATAWDNAVRELVKLDRLLATPDLARVAAVEEQRGLLSRGSEELWSPFREEGIDNLLARARREKNAAVYRDLEAVLASPWPAGRHRARLWATARQLEQLLQQQVEALDADSGAADGSGIVVGLRPADLRQQVELRARLAVGLLKLTGLPEGDRLEQALEKVQATPDPEAWQALGDNLRAAWLQHLFEHFRAARTASADAERLSRLVPVLERELGSMPAEPAEERRRQERDAYRAWLEDHLRAAVP